MSDLISFDYAIKYLLKDKGDYEIVEGFISALIASEGYKPIKIKALLESESNKESKYLKRSIADVIVEDEQGNNYIVEIDRAYTNLFLHKAVFNTSRLIVDNLGTNQDYLKIKKVFHCVSLNHFFALSCILRLFDSFADAIRYSVASLPNFITASFTSLTSWGQSGILTLQPYSIACSTVRGPS